MTSLTRYDGYETIEKELIGNEIETGENALDKIVTF